MTDQLIPMATIESEAGHLTLAYDVIEHCIYALNNEGEPIEKVASPELPAQSDAEDFISDSYALGWGLSWID